MLSRVVGKLGLYQMDNGDDDNDEQMSFVVDMV